MKKTVLRGLTCASLVAGLALVGSPTQAETGAQKPVSPRFAEIAASDPTAEVGGDGHLYFVEPVPERPRPTSQRAVEARAPEFPLSDTFDLHSAPGSQRTIFLDFDGHHVSGTAWNKEEGVPAGSHPAWTLDGNAGAFNNRERTVIQEVWRRVAEDFAPFDVNVTTRDPGEAALLRSGAGDQVYGTRVLITPSNRALQAICGGSCVGIAYMDVFDEVGGAHQPVWVFPQFYNSFIDDGGAKGIAETISHEVGHNLNLGHDGDSEESYHTGHNSWAPIMGGSDDEPISQWSKGDYPDADNRQDDLAVIARSGLSLRADEAGRTIASAAAAPPAGTAYITSRSDKDFYHLGECAGAVRIAAAGASVGTNLDIELRLYRTDGTQVATANPTSAKVSAMVASGMNATIDANVTAGAYVVAVDGVGRGNWSTGYDDYASIGAYTLRATGCDGVPTDPEPEPEPEPDPVKPGRPKIVSASSGAPGGPVTGSLRWTVPDDGGAPIKSYRVKATRWSASGKKLGSGTTTPFTTGQMSTMIRLRTPGIWSFQVQARNEVGWSPFSSPSKKIRGR